MLLKELTNQFPDVFKRQIFNIGIGNFGISLSELLGSAFVPSPECTVIVFNIRKTA